jgi:hypothetical protein
MILEEISPNIRNSIAVMAISFLKKRMVKKTDRTSQVAESRLFFSFSFNIYLKIRNNLSLNPKIRRRNISMATKKHKNGKTTNKAIVLLLK